MPQAFDIRAPSTRRSYVVTFSANATTAMDLFGIEAPIPDPRQARLIRLQRIVIDNPGTQGTAAVVSLSLVWTAAASTGPKVTAVPIDPRNPAALSVCHSANTYQTAGATTLATYGIYVPTAAAAFTPFVIEMGGAGMVYQQPTATQTLSGYTGLALRHPGATSAAGLIGYAVFCEELV